MSGTEEEVGGEPVDEIAKIAGPIGGLWENLRPVP